MQSARMLYQLLETQQEIPYSQALRLKRKVRIESLSSPASSLHPRRPVQDDRERLRFFLLNYCIE
jgi:hypothetical protein